MTNLGIHYHVSQYYFIIICMSSYLDFQLPTSACVVQAGLAVWFRQRLRARAEQLHLTVSIISICDPLSENQPSLHLVVF